MTEISMSKTIMALAGSPNKGGNSDSLMESFLEGVKEVHPDVQVEKTYIYDLDCAPFEHKTKVPLESEIELAALGEKLKSASGLIIATPTFNFNVPGPLKNFIDRIGYMALDYKNINKLGQPTGQLGHLRTFFIVTGGTPNFYRRMLFFVFPPFWLSVAFKYYYAKSGGALYEGKLTFRNPVKEQPKVLARAKKRGIKYAQKYL